MANGYVLRDFKFGSQAWGTSGGQVTWSFATTAGALFAFDAAISDAYHQDLITRAFQAWEDVANIDFVQVADSAASDIRLGWDAIDVPAHWAQQIHTAYANNGQFEVTAEIRFDPVKTASIATEIFLGLAMHEIGHAIGLDHIDDKSLIMNPIIYVSSLAPGDIAGAQYIYGPASNAGTPNGDEGNEGGNPNDGSLPGETINGDGGDNYLYGTGSNNQINGGDGIDFAIYSHSAFDYDLSYTDAGRLIVFHRHGVDGTDTLDSVERVAFSDFTFALDVGGVPGQAYRIYQAAFARTPDDAGLGYWIREMDAGRSLYEVSKGFVSSQEFADLYGYGVSSANFVGKLYENVLRREGETEGISFWSGQLDAGRMDAAAVLANFSESPENVAGVTPLIQDGFWYA